MDTVEPVDTVNSGVAHVQFICPVDSCEALFDGDVTRPIYDLTKDVNEAIGRASTPVCCPRCGTPYVVDATADESGTHYSLRDDHDVWVRHVDMTDFFDDLDLDDPIPTEPYEVYVEARKRLDAFWAQQTIDTYYMRTLYSMVFIQYVTLMEAYLGDRLAKLVFDHNDRLLLLVRSTESLREQNLTLLELANDPDILQDKVKAFFQNFSFHNLTKVAKLYRTTLKVEILSDPREQEELKALIQLRHDLVHRNGKDRDGKDCLLDDSHIQAVAALTSAIVKRVENRYLEFHVARVFGADATKDI